MNNLLKVIQHRKLQINTIYQPLQQIFSLSPKIHMQNNSELNLYFNCKLTFENIGNKNNLRPTYIQKSIEDSKDKIEILFTSIKSMRELKFHKAIFNIELDQHYSKYLTALKDLIHKTFKSTIVHYNQLRPNTLNAWREDCSFAKNFFGKNATVLCIFNHDHIFVEHNPEFFLEDIQAAFAEKRPRYFIYSHFPEQLSSIVSTDAYRYRLNKLFSINIPLENYSKTQNNIFISKITGWIDGIFVTNVIGLEHLWANLKFSGTYLARPDWPGASLGGTKLEVLAASREYFRHFDGYNHISELKYLNGMRLSQFYSNGVLKVSYLLSSELKSEPLNAKKIANFYYKIFKRNFTLALRDLWLFSLETGAKTKYKNIYISTLNIFIEFYIKRDSLAFCIQEETMLEIVNNFVNKCHRNFTKINNNILVDVFSNTR